MVGLGIILAFLAAFLFVTRVDPRDRSTWASAAKRLRLTANGEGFGGIYRQLPVTVKATGSRVLFTVGPVARIGDDLLIRKAPPDGEGDEELEGRMITGDAGFDRRVVVLGRREVVTAIMDWETRQRVATMVRDLDLELTNTTLRASLRGTDHAASLLSGELTALVTLARRLRYRDETAADRYYDNAGEDPKPQVRLRNLEALVERHPDTELAREALRRARTDPDARVRAVGE